MVTGAAIASANTAAATSSAYSAGVAAGSANTEAAYSAGVATGAVAAGASTTTTVTVHTTYVTGAIYPTVPAGAMVINKNNATYYLSGNTWFKPAFGANGIYYMVVPTP
jgi:hypothetical protein